MTSPPLSSPPTSLASQALQGGPVPAGSPSAHRRLPLNLSRQPFVNTRPVTRVALFLWIGGAILLALNIALFWSYLGRSEQTRTALASAERGTEHEKELVKTVETRLTGLNLERQNREVTYLNRKIAERVFAWSALFDRMATVLPDGVRLIHLTPSGLGGKEPGTTGPIRPLKNDVTLDMSGEAKSDEALLLFVDRLFANSAFSEPHLTHQEQVEDGLVHFELRVQYLPDVPLQSPPAASAVSRPAKASAAPSTLPRITRGVAHRPPGTKP